MRGQKRAGYVRDSQFGYYGQHPTIHSNKLQVVARQQLLLWAFSGLTRVPSASECNITNITQCHHRAVYLFYLVMLPVTQHQKMPRTQERHPLTATHQCACARRNTARRHMAHTHSRTHTNTFQERHISDSTRGKVDVYCEVSSVEYASAQTPLVSSGPTTRN